MADVSNPHSSREAKPGSKSVAKDTDIPIGLLNACFVLDPTLQGNLKWKTRPRDHFADEPHWSLFNTRFAGKPAGSKNTRGDYRVRLTIGKQN